jgi:L-fuculose-phosphate aldolase
MNQARKWKKDAREAISDVSHRLYERGYLVATSGNISTRTKSGFLITPASTRKDSITESSVVECNPDGLAIDPDQNPSSETAMHRQVYKSRDDIGAAIHAHPHYSLACSLAGISLTEMLLPELAIYIGPVPSVPYATPGTDDMAKVLTPFLSEHSAFLLQKHGVLVLGTDLENAFNRLEHLEHVAHVAYLMNSMGTIEPLTKIELAKLTAQAKKR